MSEGGGPRGDRAAARAAAEPVRVRAELREPVARTLRWLLSLRDAEGRIVCPDHRIEHTGKSAGAAVIALELARWEPDDALVEAAIQQGRRMVANLVCEEASVCHTFRPGRHDAYNCSNSVIDGGACSDALAALVLGLGDRLGAADREAFAAASLLHARSYLRYAVLDKGVPAQRAWGLSGLAGAFALERDRTLEDAAIEAVGVLEGVQNPDGSYPYHPLEWGAEHPGSSDVSSFYQSRVTGFLLFALERLGRDPTSGLFRAPLRRGLDFLVALQGPDGIKCGLVEAKPWYWGATYEVASHPFDAYALARGWSRFGRAEYGRGALAAFRAWADHLGADGRPASHRPGPGRGRSYQCANFWAGHAGWMARALPDLERALARGVDAEDRRGGIDLSVAWFPFAQLGRLDDGRVAVWVRGARPAVNVHHGSPHGAGLLRVHSRAEGRELLERCRLGGEGEAEWSGRSGLPSPARGWRSGAREVRFSTWLVRNHLRGRRFGAALRAPFDVARRGILAFGAPRVSSAFHLAPEVRTLPDGIVLESALAFRDGSPLAKSRLARSFRIDGEGLTVEEACEAAGGARGLAYRVPASAREVERSEGRVRYRLG